MGLVEVLKAIQMNEWKFFTNDGKLIGVFPSTFHVNAYVFLIVMSAHAYAWKLPYMRG